MSVLVDSPISTFPRAALDEHGLLDHLPAQMIELQEVEEDAEDPDAEHEDQEDGFLCGAGDVTVRSLRARRRSAHEVSRDVETEEEPLSHDEGHLQDGTEAHVEDVVLG